MTLSTCKKIVLVFIAVCIAGCTSLHVYLLPADSQENAPSDIVDDALTHLTGISPYSSKTAPGDSFLVTVLPGIGLSDTDLRFSTLSGSDLTGDLKALDQAYRFSQIVDQLLVSGSTYQNSGIQLGNIYSCLLLQISPDDKPYYQDLNLIKISSATYNDSFFLTSVTPAEEAGKRWVDYVRDHNLFNVTVVEGKSSQSSSTNLPLYRFKASLKRLQIQRPWFREELLHKAKERDSICYIGSSHKKQSYAIITGLILAKNLDVQEYSTENNSVFISKNGEITDLKALKPTATMKADGPLLIGLICVLL